MLGQGVLAAGSAALVVLLARRAGALSPSGTVAAWCVGTASALAGWDWATVLIAFFVGGSLLSRLGGARKAERLAPILEKQGARDATQVLANGGVFALAALGHLVAPDALFLALGSGALAAATADTVATEVGTLSRRPPRSILSGQRLSPGESGGVTMTGSLAMVAGAGAVAGLAWLLGWGAAVAIAAFAGGVAGALADSLLGAIVQERRWCSRCEQRTERTVHRCGTTTGHLGGVRGVGNDMVNVACTLTGALLAAWLAM